MANTKAEPFYKLKSRIMKEFPQKKLIGDISIEDEEYQMLVDYFKNQYRRIISGYYDPNPNLAVVLVQIGIRYYDGSFWPHLAHELGLKSIPANQQISIGDTFYRTLAHYNKLRMQRGEYVKNILMHGFVSDHYSADFFNFLFAFYRIDLERDITRLNRVMMNDLYEVMVRNDNTGRTYWLVQQTADAIRANPKGTKIRIRRLLRLIDRCFWDQITPRNTANRLTRNYIKWQLESEDFQIEAKKYHGGYQVNHGPKSFSSPYLECSLSNSIFWLVLPTQLVKFDYADNLTWKITHDGQTNWYTVESYQGVTGLKTEQISIPILPEHIFSNYDIELVYGETRLRLFKIKSDCVRFFRKDGVFIQGNTLPQGEVYAFTRCGETIIFDGYSVSERRGNLTLYYFVLEYGDILRLPDGKPLAIGKKLEEGMMPRGRLFGAYSYINGEQVPIYKKPPIVFIKMIPSRAAGTIIIVNTTQQYRFSKESAVEVELDDRSGEIGYILKLSDYGCIQNGTYEVVIDVPNDRKNRYFQFALINHFEFSFEDAPYIFKPRGTIRFPENLSIISDNGGDKIKGENAFNFVIDPQKDNITFYFKWEDNELPLSIFVPAFKWRFDNGPWVISQPPEIWHSDFPKMIYLKYPDDSITLSLDDDSILYDHTVQSQTFYKLKEKHQFECDMTRYLSWLGRSKDIRTLYLEFSDRREEFFRIITKSQVSSCIIRGDYEKDLITCQFQIIGKSNYYADVAFGDRLIAEKIEIQNGRIDLSVEISSGRYTVLVYEQDDDGTGFGEPCFLPIARFDQEILNPYDLTGKSLIIEYLKTGELSIFKEQINGKYIISNLRRDNAKDKQRYVGRMSVELQGEFVAEFDVQVVFEDLEKLRFAHINFLEENGDYEKFYYEEYLKILAKYEDWRLSSTERYRRYKVLDEDYIYVVNFIDSYVHTKNINMKSSFRRYFDEIKPTIKNNKLEVKWKESGKKLSNLSHYQSQKNQKTVNDYRAQDTQKTEHENEITETSLSAKSKPVSISVKNIDLHPMVYNCLIQSGYQTVDDLVKLISQKGINGLNSIRKLNADMQAQVINSLRKQGINL